MVGLKEASCGTQPQEYQCAGGIGKMRNWLRFVRNTARSNAWFAAGHNTKMVLYEVLKMLVVKWFNNVKSAVVT